MSLRSATIVPSALRKIRSLVKSAKDCEIGGPMVGFLTEDQALVITDVEGPGPRGKCLPFNVTIDGEYSQKFCDMLHRNTNGAWDFVGDWHCHPGIFLRPSVGDCLAMKLLADTPGLVANPVSLIYSRVLRTYRIYEWENCQERLIALPRG